MAVHDTEENNRSEYTHRTLACIARTVAFSKHRLIIINNNSCVESERIIESFCHIEGVSVIHNTENIGTAAAINQAWEQRIPGEHCIKIDNDVVIHSRGWVEEMEEVLRRDSSIGQVGLKRKDCWENVNHINPDYKSTLIQLPHEPGETWVVVERAKHIMGTCVMHNAALIDKIGGLWQPGIYGYDDVDYSWRCNLSGFISVFLPHINIDHIDNGGTPYQSWKEKHAGQYSKQMSDIVDGYISGEISMYKPI